jgi:hypothetical protein
MGDVGPSGPPGPKGDPGPEGPPFGIRVLRSNCDESRCMIQCSDDEMLLSAYCGTRRNTAAVLSRCSNRLAQMHDHSITSSARALNIGGNSNPTAFAVFRLITSSNLTDCITGRSAGLSPLRILAV